MWLTHKDITIAIIIKPPVIFKKTKHIKKCKGTVVQQLELFSHSRKVVGLNPLGASCPPSPHVYVASLPVVSSQMLVRTGEL